jgi:hypothetical protein
MFISTRARHDPTRNMKLSRDVTLALAFKFAMLVLLYATLFSPSHRPPANTGTHLFSANPPGGRSGEPIGQR